uniref:Syndecan n=1 Tax=Angiostrongylus cantonensis TaxID=6313 RepID=A0A0K0DRN1_ANGCA
MPITLTDEQMAPARLLTLTPSGNTTQSISSTVTTMPGESIPLVGSVTAMGVSLLQGMIICPEARHTTTIITTTTTTYRMVEVSDSDSLSDDFEVLDENALTVDVSLLTPGTSSPQSPQYMIVGKRESEGHLSPITRSRMDIDLQFPPIGIERSTELDEKPIMEMVSVYHSGFSDLPYKQSEENKFEESLSKKFYQEDQPHYRNEEDERNNKSSSDLKTISTSSEDEDIELIDTDMAQVTSNGNSTDEVNVERHIETPLSKENKYYHIDIENEWLYEVINGNMRDSYNEEAIDIDYPAEETYDESRTISIQRMNDIKEEPITHHVTVYHSGRSDEPVPKLEEAHSDLSDAAKTFGDKITGLFRRRPTIPDYPSTEPYYGPLADTRRREDIDSQPLHTAVTIYHSGRSDIPHEKVVFIQEAVEVHKEMHYDYPTTTAYEGPLDSTQRID